MGAVRASQLLGLPVQQTAISLSVASGNWSAAPRRRLPGISTPRAQEGPTQKSSSPARSGSAAPQAHRPCFSSPLNLEPYQRFPDGFGAWRRGGMLGSSLTMLTQPRSSSDPRALQNYVWRQADVREAMQCGEQDHRVSQPSRRWRCFWPAARISPKIKAVVGESGAASLPWTFGQSHTACTTACTTQLPIACRPAERCTEIAQRHGSVTGFQGEDREGVQQLLEVEALLTPLELKGLQCPSCRRHLQEATGDATKGNTNPAFRARAN